MRTISIIVMFVMSTLLGISQEKQVAFEPGGKIRSIDAVLAKKLGIFNEYPDFQQAMLFQQNDSSYVLEILTGTKNDNLRTRKLMTASETELFLSDIGERLKIKSPRSMLDQEGRTSLLFINSLVSYSFYGTAISAILTEDMSPAVYLLSAGAGFVAPMLITRNKDVTMPQAIMAGYGQTRGIAHGMLLPLVFGSDVDFRVSLGFGLAGSITEALIGYNWARKSGVNNGQAGTIGMYSDLGMIMSLGAANSLGLFEFTGDFTPNAFALTTLAGATGGLLYGHALSKKDYYSEGDIAMTGNLFLLGAYLPLSIMAAAEVENSRWYTTVGTLGAAAGIWGGDKLAQQFDFSNRQSMFASLSMIGGGFLGAGVGHLLEEMRDKDDEYWYDYDPTLISVMSALGAAAGLGLSLLNYTKDINRENKDLSLKIQFNPLGFANARLTASDPTGKNAIPVVMGRVRF